MDLATPRSARVSVPFWRYTPEPATLRAHDLLADRVETWSDRSRFVALTSARPYAIWRLTPEYDA